MDIVESIMKVLLVGLILGAGLPALFAVGLRCHAQGAPGVGADGTISNGNAPLRLLGYAIFAVVALVIVTALLWITRQTIYYYFDVKIFPFGYK
ncbi:hypothetical protein [Gordonia sp. WA4-43]|uniref:hypothetical protein n=1 Tax=Gordonia sp. WA4-43 TaxID=2878678 RepID=UPI001CF93008|nr:hypothetical protein [Gordonia sp. WA4-43]UCZ90047.1 hypothetical protein LEL84_24160 [Gordonia sp. WA4-43]